MFKLAKIKFSRFYYVFLGFLFFAPKILRAQKDSWRDVLPGGKYGAWTAIKAKGSELAASAGEGLLKALMSMFWWLLETILTGIQWFVGTITFLVGKLFDEVFDWTVVDFSKVYNDISEPINQVWIMLRDISNIVFIFLILIVAIKIITSGNLFGQKKRLGLIIVVAILINFSLFFTKVAIDFSNYATIAIYKGIEIDGENMSSQNSLSVNIMGSLGLTSFFSDSKDNKISGSLVAKQPGKYIMLLLFQIFLTIILIPIFLYAIVVMLFRFISIIILIIASPIAIVSIVLPKGKEAIFDKWMQELSTNLFFPPVFLLLINVTLVFANKSYAELAKGKSFGVGMSDLKSFITETFGLFLNFALITTFLFLTVHLSRKISVKGGGMSAEVINMSSKAATRRMRRVTAGATVGAAGAVGRNTAGRLGSMISTRKFANADNFVSRGIKRGAEKVGNSSFDARDNKWTKKNLVDKALRGDSGHGYKDSIKEKGEKMKKEYEELGKLSNKEKAEEIRNMDKFDRGENGVKLQGHREELDQKESERSKIELKLSELRSDPESSEEDIKNAETDLNKLNSGISGIKSEIQKLEKIRKDETKSTKGTDRQKRFAENTLSTKKYTDRMLRDNNGKYKNKVAAATGGVVSLVNMATLGTLSSIAGTNTAGTAAKANASSSVKKEEEKKKKEKEKEERARVKKEREDIEWRERNKEKEPKSTEDRINEAMDNSGF